MLNTEGSNLLSVSEAIAILDGAVVTPRIVRLPLRDALGLRLAEQISSDRDYPPFDKAVMDGFAVRAADVAASGATLRVVDTVAAGALGERTVQAGEAIAIMTGAPLPPGADAVVPVEETTRDGDRVTFRRAARAGEAIARRASDIEAGRVVLAKGARLGPVQVAVAANVGASEITVFAQPSVAVLSTGDELVEIDAVPSGAQIRNSNSVMLVALLRRLGCDVRDLGIARDDPAVIRDAILNGLSLADALFIAGGMSMGERDYVPRLLQELGMDLRITKLRIKPGKPFVFAVAREFDSIRDKFVFGLPGNPVSAFVCTLRLASRVLARMAGGTPDGRIGEAKLSSPLPANGPREFYQPALRIGSGVDPMTWKGSADIFTLAAANCLIIRPADARPAEAGDVVPIIEIGSL
jgi:molybdopterin molybdotransferase